MDQRPDFAHYAVRHPDGRWLYNLPEATGHNIAGILAEHVDDPGAGHPMTRLSDTSRWWSTTAPATRILLVINRPPLVTGYQLTDPDTASVKYPATLTVDEWKERTSDAGDFECDRMWGLYTRTTQPQDPQEKYLDGPFITIDGTEPPTGDGPAWQPNLIDSITQRPEYAHLFPGQLHNFRDQAIKAIKALPRVEHCFDGFQGDPRVYVCIRVPYEQPETTFVRNTGSRGQKLQSGRNKPVTVDRRIYLPIPKTIPGDNQAAALAEWDRQIAYWTGVVNEASVAACNHCRGTGHVPTGAEQYTKAPR